MASRPPVAPEVAEAADAGPLLAGRRIVVTGVLTDHSFAYHAAERMQQLGAEIVLTGHGRAKRLTARSAEMLPDPPDVLELDVTEPAHFAALADELAERWGRVDGVLHSIAYAPKDLWTSPFFEVSRDDLDIAVHTSVYSMSALVGSLADLLRESPHGPAVVGLTTIPGRLTPHYSWMGVVKAMLDALVKQMAIQLGPDGIRVNLIAPGPVRTNAGRSVPGIDAIAREYERAPLGWDRMDVTVAADAACFLLSGMARHITGEVLDVDGGMHVTM